MSGITRSDIEVLRLVYRDRGFESRLSETSSGDVQFLQWGVPVNLDLPEEEMIACLFRLEHEGYIRSKSEIHTYDPNEYILEWQVTPKGRNRLTVQ